MRGMGTWSRATGSVPVTEPGESLGVLDISDSHYPKLHMPTSEAEVEAVEFSPAGEKEKNIV